MTTSHISHIADRQHPAEQQSLALYEACSSSGTLTSQKIIDFVAKGARLNWVNWDAQECTALLHYTFSYCDVMRTGNMFQLNPKPGVFDRFRQNIDTMVEYGVDLNYHTSSQDSALATVAYHQDEWATQILLTAGCDPLLPTPYHTNFYLACAYQAEGSLECLHAALKYSTLTDPKTIYELSTFLNEKEKKEKNWEYQMECQTIVQALVQQLEFQKHIPEVEKVKYKDTSKGSTHKI